MVRVPLMTPIGYGGGSSCSLSSRSQAAQCNIHQAFIIALLAMFHGVRVRIKPADEWAFQAIDTGEETFDNSLVMFNAGKISWKTAGAAGRHQPL